VTDLIIFALHQISSGGGCSTYGKTKKQINIWLENLKGRDHMGDIRIDSRIILKCSLNEV
jgi:hypothetical protein